MLREAKQKVPEELLKFGTTVKKKVRHEGDGDSKREKGDLASPIPSWCAGVEVVWSTLSGVIWGCPKGNKNNFCGFG